MTNVLNKDDGCTVRELADALLGLVVLGKGDCKVYERRGDEPIRYVDIYEGKEGRPSRVLIGEAY